MARDFSTTGKYLSRGSVIISAEPFSFSAWIFINSFSSNNVIYGCTNGTVTDGFYMHIDTGGKLLVSSRQANVGAAATTVAVVSLSTWTHVCGVWASTTSRSAYISGGNKVTNATSKVPSGMTDTRLAANGNTVNFNGIIAFGVLYSAALSDTDVAALAAKASPFSIRPDSIADYWPLTGGNSPEPGIRGNLMSLVSTPVESVNPALFLP